jgi:hypothetical protein
VLSCSCFLEQSSVSSLVPSYESDSLVNSLLVPSLSSSSSEFTVSVALVTVEITLLFTDSSAFSHKMTALPILLSQIVLTPDTYEELDRV